MLKNRLFLCARDIFHPISCNDPEIKRFLFVLTAAEEKGKSWNENKERRTERNDGNEKVFVIFYLRLHAIHGETSFLPEVKLRESMIFARFTLFSHFSFSLKRRNFLWIISVFSLNEVELWAKSFYQKSLSCRPLGYLKFSFLKSQLNLFCLNPSSSFDKITSRNDQEYKFVCSELLLR